MQKIWKYLYNKIHINIMNKKERIYYIDILKSLAIFSVVFIHVFALGEISQIKGITISSFAEIFKFAVPIFIMISGALLLNRNYDSISSFLKRKYTRLIPPYLLWILFVIFALIYPPLSNHNPIDLSIVYTTIFNFPHAWYFWLMIGVYLLIPVLNEFIKTDDIKASKYIVSIFILSSILYQTLVIFKAYTFLDLSFFISPIGYLCLGYLLSRYEFKNTNLVLIASILLFIITSTIKVINADSPEVILIFSNLPVGFASLMDISIFRIVQAGSLFLIIKYLPFKLSKIKKIITSISRSSYGIYLVHISINLLVFNFVPVTGSGTKVFLTLLIGTFVVFLISWIIVLITSRIPYISKLSGYD